MSKTQIHCLISQSKKLEIISFYKIKINGKKKSLSNSLYFLRAYVNRKYTLEHWRFKNRKEKLDQSPTIHYTENACNTLISSIYFINVMCAWLVKKSTSCTHFVPWLSISVTSVKSISRDLLERQNKYVKLKENTAYD